MDGRRNLLPSPVDLLLILLMVALAVHGTRADEPADDGEPTKYELAYQLEIGEVLRYSVDHKAAVRSTINDTTQEAQTKTESVKNWKVTDVLPSGEIEIMHVVERVHMVNRLPDRPAMEYDSEKDEAPPPGFEQAARAVGVPLSVVRITPAGKVVHREEKLSRAQRSAGDDAPIVLRLPDEPVAIGATWDEPLEVQVTLNDNGGTKRIQTRRHYRLTDVSAGIATIEVTYQVLSPINAEIESQLVQRLMKGRVRFDLEAGRIASQHFEVDKRVLGFAGPTSSMHYVMEMEERLLNLPSGDKSSDDQLADKPSGDERSTR